MESASCMRADPHSQSLVLVLLLSTAIHVGRKAVSCEADANQMVLITKDIVAGQSRAPMGCFRPLVCCWSIIEYMC